jgi:hypothetical protein
MIDMGGAPVVVALGGDVVGMVGLYPFGLLGVPDRVR